MKLYTLGTSHGATEPGRACSANLVEVNGAYYLFDCGGDVERKMKNMEMPFDNLRAVFISHMHEDHVGTLSSVAKRFYVYNKTENRVSIHMPEQNGIEAFCKWLEAIHLNTSSGKVIYNLVQPGVVYADENITVTAIATKHLENGLFPSYAYVVASKDKKLLYTGDLNYTFCDYPEVAFTEDFDAILCELVHFKLENNLDTIKKSATQKLIFTHGAPKKILQVQAVKNQFPFEVEFAEDGNVYKI